MNSIRQIQALNKRELENAVPSEASWHADYRDTAYIYIGGLPFDLSEGDIVSIFSQFGEPVHINLVRDKETGKSRGFAFLKYEDQRSTDLAVDNLGGATVMGRTLRVDHVRYKRRDDEGDEDNLATMTGHSDAGADRRDDDTDTERRGRGSRRAKKRSNSPDAEDQTPILKEEIELAELMRDHDEEDPMKEYLIQEKKEEVARALGKLKLKLKNKKSSRRRDDSQEHFHRHRDRHHRRRRSEERSRSREVARRKRSTSREQRVHRDEEPPRDRPGRERSSSRQRTYHRDTPRSQERLYRNKSEARSRSPDRRRDRRRRSRDR